MLNSSDYAKNYASTIGKSLDWVRENNAHCFLLRMAHLLIFIHYYCYFYSYFIQKGTMFN